jgi:hypothetical protein
VRESNVFPSENHVFASVMSFYALLFQDVVCRCHYVKPVNDAGVCDIGEVETCEGEEWAQFCSILAAIS